MKEWIERYEGALKDMLKTNHSGQKIEAPRELIGVAVFHKRRIPEAGKREVPGLFGGATTSAMGSPSI